MAYKMGLDIKKGDRVICTLKGNNCYGRLATVAVDGRWTLQEAVTLVWDGHKSRSQCNHRFLEAHNG